MYCFFLWKRIVITFVFMEGIKEKMYAYPIILTLLFMSALGIIILNTSESNTSNAQGIEEKKKEQEKIEERREEREYYCSCNCS